MLKKACVAVLKNAVTGLYDMKRSGESAWKNGVMAIYYVAAQNQSDAPASFSKYRRQLYLKGTEEEGMFEAANVEVNS